MSVQFHPSAALSTGAGISNNVTTATFNAIRSPALTCFDPTIVRIEAGNRPALDALYRPDASLNTGTRPAADSSDNAAAETSATTPSQRKVPERAARDNAAGMASAIVFGFVAGGIGVAAVAAYQWQQSVGRSS